MALRWFDPPVFIDTEPDTTRSVRHVEGAARELLRFRTRGAHWLRAVDACVAAMQDEVPAQEVQKWFKLAAKAEGVLRDR